MQENTANDTDIYSYENRQKIYNEAREKFLNCEQFEINGKMCDSLIEVMKEDINYLYSCFENVKEIITEDENGNQHKELKVGNTPLNIELAKTINLVNKQIINARDLNRELGKVTDKIVAKNKELQTKIKSQYDNQGFAEEELIKQVGDIAKEMVNNLNSFVNNDTIAIALVEYRNQLLNEYESYLNKQKD